MEHVWTSLQSDPSGQDLMLFFSILNSWNKKQLILHHGPNDSQKVLLPLVNPHHSIALMENMKCLVTKRWLMPTLLEDEHYYTEMAQNYEHATRVTVAEAYKRAAWDYIWEAISIYLEWKQTEQLRGMFHNDNLPSYKLC
jgi:hypothetical protein